MNYVWRCLRVLGDAQGIFLRGYSEFKSKGVVHDFWITGRETISTIRMTRTIRQGQVKMHWNLDWACLEVSVTSRGFGEPWDSLEKHWREWEQVPDMQFSLEMHQQRHVRVMGHNMLLGWNLVKEVLTPMRMSWTKSIQQVKRATGYSYIVSGFSGWWALLHPMIGQNHTPQSADITPHNWPK